MSVKRFFVFLCFFFSKFTDLKNKNFNKSNAFNRSLPEGCQHTKMSVVESNFMLLDVNSNK